MEKKVIKTEHAPQALGPYSQGIVAGPWVFAAGQLGLDPATGAMVAGGVAAQTEQVLRNVEGILHTAGSNLGKVVRMTVYLASMEHFPEVNAVLAKHFINAPPARATVAVAGLPLQALVEIEVQALL